MDNNQVKEEVSLLSDYNDDSDNSTSPTPLLGSDVKNQDTILTRSQTTLGCVKYLLFQLCYCTKHALLSFIPSFIPRYGSSAREPLADRRISPTAYLDGLRGIACLVVFMVHFVHNWFPALRNTYGASPTDHYFFQLPIVRVLMGGREAVATFFVISGYALSYRALSKIQEGNKSESLDVLSSSTFRRCLRIYLPCAVNTFMCMLFSYYGFYTPDPLNWHTLPPRLPTFMAQLGDWWAHQMVLMYPFHGVEGAPYSPPYNGHMWTILLEIRGSFVVYGTVLAVSKMTRFWRGACLAAFDFYLWYMAKWDLFLFISGVLLAYWDIPRHVAAKRATQGPASEGDDYLPTHSPGMNQMTVENATSESSSIISKAVRFGQMNITCFHRVFNPVIRISRSLGPYFLFISSLWLLSFPHVPVGKDFLFSLVPARYAVINDFYGRKTAAIRIIGAVLLPVALSLSSPRPRSIASSETQAPPSRLGRLLAATRNFNLQWLFTNALSQYLGRVSFGFYLMHGPVLFCIGTKILTPAAKEWNATHDNGLYRYRFLTACVVNIVVVVCAADWFARVVDERSVRWASTVARFMSQKTKEGLASRS